MERAILDRHTEGSLETGGRHQDLACTGPFKVENRAKPSISPTAGQTANFGMFPLPVVSQSFVWSRLTASWQGFNPLSVESGSSAHCHAKAFERNPWDGPGSLRRIFVIAPTQNCDCLKQAMR
jgi:hypothetical protein